jgi:C-terminal processing protease CtpA/Prc
MYFLISTILHLSLLFWGASGYNTSVGTKQQGGDSYEITIVERSSEGEGKPCKYSYGGIGITGYPKIETVHPGYPAEKIGIKVGDLVYSFEDIRGEPGTQVEIRIVSGNTERKVVVTRERICYNK